MIQTWAIFVDAYRELNSKKMFWLVLILSAFFVLGFAAVGVKQHTLIFLGYQSGIPISSEPAEFYKFCFNLLGVHFWLTWAAMILALVSTAGIFPDFMAGGSIDLFLSKPIGRLRLFTTKYLAGLLFVALQVGLFCTASFFVIGFRGGTWEPGLFLAIPIVLCIFSYLYCIMVLVGVLTRSTIASILLTVLFWFLLFILTSAESGLLMFRIAGDRRSTVLERQIHDADERIATLQARPDETGARLRQYEARRTALQRDLAETQRTAKPINLIHRIVFQVKTVLPKTADTLKLLDRALSQVAQLPPVPEQSEPVDPLSDQRNVQPGDPEVMREYLQAEQGRSVAWVLGTSLAFEAVIVAWAAWRFCRRDF